MGRATRFEVMQFAKPLIMEFFQNSSTKLFSERDLSGVLTENKKLWRLSTVTNSSDFVKFLIDKKILTEVKITNPTGQSSSKYINGSISPYEIALSINKDSYVSHYSAVFLHGLTDNIPKKIYINKEQFLKSPLSDRESLIQENIDKAFTRPMRLTNNIYSFDNYCVLMLNGKNVNRLGVTEFNLEERNIYITTIERTLIDITVRPNYAGGVQEVLNAYIAAKGKCSINMLIAYLKKMDFVYPYHQAIGFYLEKAGYNQPILNLLKKFDIKHKFYLTYDMKEMDYSPEWQLYIPKGF